MSLPSKRYKQEIKFVIVNTASHSSQLLNERQIPENFFKIVFRALPQKVVCLNSSVLHGKQESILEIPSA